MTSYHNYTETTRSPEHQSVLDKFPFHTFKLEGILQDLSLQTSQDSPRSSQMSYDATIRAWNDPTVERLVTNHSSVVDDYQSCISDKRKNLFELLSESQPRQICGQIIKTTQFERIASMYEGAALGVILYHMGEESKHHEFSDLPANFTRTAEEINAILASENDVKQYLNFLEEDAVRQVWTENKESGCRAPPVAYAMSLISQAYAKVGKEQLLEFISESKYTPDTMNALRAIVRNGKSAMPELIKAAKSNTIGKVSATLLKF